MAVAGACTTSDGRNITFFSLLNPGGSDLRGPANAPPPGYDGEFWVDRRGCIFIRTGPVDGPRWVPQVDLSRKPICDPARAGVEVAPSAEASIDPTPRIEIDPETGLRLEILPPQAIPRSYVYVTAIDDQARGQTERRRFGELGFPVVGADQAPGAGQPVTVVLGPFTVQSALDDALRVAGDFGYEKAYTYRR